MSRPIVLCYGKTGCHFDGLCIADVIFKNHSYKKYFSFFVNFGYVANCDEMTM